MGHNGPANHIYDLSYFWQAAITGNLPAVSFLKAARAQDGHPGNSSPLDEQVWLTETINKLQLLPDWDETAVIIAWDDSDGWYDHAIGPVMNQSATPADHLTGAGACGTGSNSLAGIRAVAYTVHGCRWWWYLLTPNRTSWMMQYWIRLRLLDSSRIIGAWDESGPVRLIRLRLTLRRCLTSPICAMIGCS